MPFTLFFFSEIPITCIFELFLVSHKVLKHFCVFFIHPSVLQSIWLILIYLLVSYFWLQWCLMWKLIKGNPTKVESGHQKGELSAVPLDVDYRKNCQLQTLTKESSTGKNHQLQAPTGKDVHCISYKKLTTPAAQPMRNHYHPELSHFLSALSFKTTPPDFFLFLYKIMFISFVCWPCLWLLL